MTRRVPLTRGLFALVDDDDYERVMALGPWYARPSPHGQIFYAQFNHRGTGKARRRKAWMHRIVLGLSDNDPRITDHINHDGLDNRKENLRAVTNAQNQRNRRIQGYGISGITGIIWDKSRRRWAARAVIDDHLYNLGRFRDIALAVEARSRFLEERGVAP